MPERGFLIFLLFFSEFSYPGRVWTEFGTKIFFSLSRPILSPFCRKIMPERGFSIFWLFLVLFSEFSCPGRVWTEFGTKIFFFLFLGLSHEFWLKIISERGFLIFFFHFFPNFLARVEYERNSGVKFCFHIFALSHPVLGKNNGGKRFYNFLNLFTIFFGIFLPGSSMNGITD